MFNMDEDQKILQTTLMETDEGQLTITPTEARDNLNFIRGKDGSATFLPFCQKLGGSDKEGEILEIREEIGIS